MNPVFILLTLVLIYLLGRELFDDETAWIAISLTMGKMTSIIMMKIKKQNSKDLNSNDS